MGTVYLAVRSDDAYQKRVAIKVLKRGMDTDAIVGRFRNERQILASLEHPYIAGLLDGGTTADGLPYFAMEYVEGQTIVEYCESRRLDTTARLRAVHEDLRGGAVRPPEPDHPPRHQAAERARGRRRHAQASRLRHCKAAQSGAGRADAGADRRGPAADDPRVREPGTGAGPGGHHRHRRLLAGRTAVRAADGAPAVPDHEPHAGRDRTRRVQLGAGAAEHGGDRRSRNRPSTPTRRRRP